jgi:hypothetical protein
MNFRLEGKKISSSVPHQFTGTNFRFEGKKNPLVCPTSMYRFVAVPSHRDAGAGGAEVQGFSRAA